MTAEIKEKVMLGEPPMQKVEEKGLWDYIVDFFTSDSDETSKKEENKAFEKVDITSVKEQEIRKQIMQEHPYDPIIKEWVNNLSGLDQNKKIGYSFDYENFGKTGKAAVSIDDVINGTASHYQSNCSDSVADLYDYMIRNGQVVVSDENRKEFEKIHKNKMNAANMAEYFIKNAKEHDGLMLEGEAAKDPANYKPGMMIYFDNNGVNSRSMSNGEKVGHNAVVQEVELNGEKFLAVINFTGSSKEHENRIGGSDEAFKIMRLEDFIEDRGNKSGYNIKAVDMFPQNHNNYMQQVEQAVAAKMNGDDNTYYAMVNNLDNRQMIASNNIIKYTEQNESELMASKIQSIQSASDQQMYANNEIQAQASSSFKI